MMKEKDKIFDDRHQSQIGVQEVYSENNVQFSPENICT